MRPKRGIALKALAVFSRLAGSVFLLTALLSAFLAVGCGAKPPPLLKISFTADEDINPSLRDRPSPLAVRIFELTDSGLFEESDYLELDANPKIVLQDTFLSASDKVTVQPGKSDVVIEREAHKETRVVGITAGYRDIDRAIWQRWHEVPAQKAGLFSSRVRVRLDVKLHERIMEVSPAKKK